MATRAQRIFALNYSSNDVITSLNFSPDTSQFLLITSWDSRVVLYDLETNRLVGGYSHSCPVMDAAFQDPARVYSAGTDYLLKRHDFIVNENEIVGSHSDVINSVLYSNRYRCLITGSWDTTVRLWDPRNKYCLFSLRQPGKIYAMDINDEMFVGATSSSQCCVWDMKSLRAPLEQRDSIIRHIKCIRLMNDNAGYAISGVEGRVSIDYLRNNYDVPEDGFTFKCHRARRNNSELVYPVNSMRFHRGYETLVTGGSDRYVNVWCVKRKKRLTQLKRLPSAVSALSFSHDESLFAIGYSTAPAEEEQQPGLPALSGVILRRVDQWAFGPRAQE